MKKLNYKSPKAIFVPENVAAGVPGALWGAGLMVGRAVAAAMKGGIELEAGFDAPRILQISNRKLINNL